MDARGFLLRQGTRRRGETGEGGSAGPSATRNDVHSLKKEVRVIAESMSDRESKQMLMSVARDYLQLAATLDRMAANPKL